MRHFLVGWLDGASVPEHRPPCQRPAGRISSSARMNQGHLTADARRLASSYVRCMQAVRRAAGGDPGMIFDAGMGITGAGLTAVAVWDPAGLAGTRIAGPPWLLALLPLLIGVPLALRRRAPLLMVLAISAGIALQCLITRHPPNVLELLV